jgi:hypothetical protein
MKPSLIVATPIVATLTFREAGWTIEN